jgi:hypothetical protein
MFVIICIFLSGKEQNFLKTILNFFFRTLFFAGLL